MGGHNKMRSGNQTPDKVLLRLVVQTTSVLEGQRVIATAGLTVQIVLFLVGWSWGCR